MVSWQIPVSALELWKQTQRPLSFQSREEPDRCSEQAAQDNKSHGFSTLLKKALCKVRTLSSIKGCLQNRHKRRGPALLVCAMLACAQIPRKRQEGEGRQVSRYLAQGASPRGHSDTEQGQVRSEDEVNRSHRKCVPGDWVSTCFLLCNGFIVY